MKQLKSMEEIGIFNVKTHLSALLQKVQHGKTFIITLRGKPVAQLQPYQENRQRTQQALTNLRKIRSSVTGTVNIFEYIQEGRKY